MNAEGMPSLKREIRRNMDKGEAGKMGGKSRPLDILQPRFKGRKERRRAWKRCRPESHTGSLLGKEKRQGLMEVYQIIKKRKGGGRDFA